jgi:hypothetical protein
VKISNETLEEAVLRLARERGEADGICPSEVARDIASKAGLDWKSLLLEVRATAVRLAKRRDIAILRNGEPVDPDRFRGLYRIAPADRFDDPVPKTAPAAPPLDPLIVPAAAVAEPPPPPRFADEQEFVREIVASIAQAELSVAVPDDIEPRVVLTMDDLLHGDLEDGDLEYLPPLVFDDDSYETQPYAYETPRAPEPEPEPEDEEDYDPDLYRAPDAATLDDVAAGLQRYLAPELDDAPRWDAEIGDDVVGLPGQEDEQPVLPSWHDAFGRYLEGSPADEERG